MLNMSHPIHSATQDPHSSVVLIRVCDREKQLSTAAAATVLFSARMEQGGNVFFGSNSEAIQVEDF